MTTQELCLHQRFEEQAAATPEALALTFEGVSLTYRQLNKQSNQLAHYLRECGVVHEQLVGLCLDRSLDTVIAILAVLKAGAAYVPMDPVYPEERVRMIVADAECGVVLCHDEHQSRFLANDSTRVVVLDGAERPWESGPVENLATEATPSSLAYVIYTSGSTGKPKGALITHWNVIRLVTEMDPWFDLRPDDVWTLFHSYAFDFSVWEIWGAYFYGGRVVVVPHLISRSPEAFYQLLVDERVTVLNQTPSAFKQLQHYDETLPLGTAANLALRYVIFGGETLDLPGLSGWFNRHGDQQPQLVNMYGITETTVFVTYRPVSIADTKPGTPNFIGIPIPDLTLYVLDEHRKPVQTGEVGELYVGGDGVGKGYFRRPELTAERFVADPLGEGENLDTFYKTGDLVRVWDGDLEFLGRNDMQVQLRGFRVELGEIESALNAHEKIRGAVVRMREDVPGDQRLVAYYLASEPQPVAELRTFLGRTLPNYMVPSAFVHRDAFPLNNNGKIDFAALPPPGDVRDDAGHVAPRTDREQALVTIWETLLGVSGVGIQDDFFQLGGHSLLVTQLILRVRAQFSVELPLRFVMEHPTIEAHARAIDEAIASGNTAGATEALPRAAHDNDAPLSFAQERLWIIDQIDRANTAYNIPIFFTLQGRADADHLRKAMQAVVARHEVLRTVFVTADGRPVQHILPALEVPFESVAPPAGNPNSTEAWAREHLQQLSQAPMDLSRGPLLRCVYIRESDSHGYLGIVVHHAIFDGWSISVLLNDLAASYEAQASGGDAALPPLARQYQDYSAWQRERAGSESFQQHLAYWKQQLAGPLPVLELPTDRPRPLHQTWEGAVAQADLDATTARRLEQFALTQRKTLFTVLIAAWNILLQRYASQDEIIIGSAIAGRNHSDLEDLIGFFVNTVVLRTTLTNDQSFVDYLRAVETVVLDAQEHQDVPFERVVAEVQHDRDPGRSPLFQVLFVLHNTPTYDVAMSGLQVSGEEVSNGCAKFDLTLAVQPRSGGFQFNLEYNTALFDRATADRILENYQTLLSSILDAPGGCIGDFEIVGPREKSLLLETWVDTAAPLDREQSLAALFEERAAADPTGIAVADDDTTLTFADLDQRANQLAHFLLSEGVSREEPIPFFLGRTVQTMVAIIGILKAGAAYVPLDLLDPPGRRERVLSVLKPRMILTERTLRPQLAETGLPLVSLDADFNGSSFPSESPGIAMRGADLAYVIFTSGSTGDPKGVCCTHQGVINLYQDLQARLPVGPGDACSIWTAFSFDVSVYESWTSLLAGATLHIIPERVRPNPEQCLAWLRERNVVTGYIPGFMLPTLLEVQRRDPVPFRRLLVGVEPLSEALLADIVAATPDLVLLNLYGPTEAAIYVTLYQVHDTHPRPKGNAPIGTAIQNTRIYTLDSAMNPVPVGVPGELYIAGVGLARGYYNDPELTARQFVPDPFSDQDTRRLYRTGDLVYFKKDGNIQFIRRMGRYIKLRGYRIEPGEIESVLRAHPHIDDAVLVLYGADSIEERLVAYVVPEQGRVLEGSELTSYLESELPAHMRPAQFVLMDVLPRTVQGKLDRRALPEPPALHGTTERVDPQTELETTLVALWKEALQTQEVGVRDNFFSLGGNSLVAIQLMTTINDRLQMDLSLHDLMDQPTIHALATRIERVRQGDAPKEPVGQRLYVLKDGTSEPFFCATGAGDVMGSYGPLAAALGDHQPFYCYSDLVDVTTSEDFTIESMAAAFVEQIRSVKPHGPYLLGGYSFGGLLAVEAARQLIANGEQVAGLMILDVSAYGDAVRLKKARVHEFMFWIRRIQARGRMIAGTWKLQIGYLRDIVRECLLPLPSRENHQTRKLTIGECLRWVWLDTMNQYFFIQAGMVIPRISDRRIEMIREIDVRDTTDRLDRMEKAQRAYVLTPLPARVTLFRVEHDPWHEAESDDTLGWKFFAQDGVDVHVIPGNHMVMNRNPFAKDLGAKLQQCLDAAVEEYRK